MKIEDLKNKDLKIFSVLWLVVTMDLKFKSQSFGRLARGLAVPFYPSKALFLITHLYPWPYRATTG